MNKHAGKNMRSIALLISAFLLVGCATKPIEVKVPVYQVRPCAPEVCRPFKPDAVPHFEADLANPQNVILTPAEQEKLRLLIVDLLTWGNALLEQSRP